MITERTVFVLGAGASIPYGFPSGPSLRHEICTETLSPGDPRHRLLIELGFSYVDIEECRDSLARSWASSIDMFVANMLQANRQSLADIAKTAIAMTIARYEKEHELFFAKPGGDWIRYLWKHIEPNLKDANQRSLVSFVTFNYDRVFERALASGVEHAHKQPQVAKSMLPEIVHVYGSLGEYPFEGANGSIRPFAAPNTAGTVMESRNALSVMCEGDRCGGPCIDARKLLEQAKRVVFLGFGYDEDNLKIIDLLQPKSCLKDDCRVFGTGFGLQPQEREWVTRLIGRFDHDAIRGPIVHIEDSEADCLMLLRRHVRSWSA